MPGPDGEKGEPRVNELASGRDRAELINAATQVYDVGTGIKRLGQRYGDLACRTPSSK